jgi:hypothetical protein
MNRIGFDCGDNGKKLVPLSATIARNGTSIVAPSHLVASTTGYEV